MPFFKRERAAEPASDRLSPVNVKGITGTFYGSDVMWGIS